MSLSRSKAALMKNILSKLLGFGLGASFSIAIIWSFESQQVLLPAPNPNAPPQSLLVVLIVAFLAVLQCCGGIRTRRKFHNSAGGRPKLRRVVASIGSNMLAMQIFFATLLFIFAEKQGWTAESVGFHCELPVLIALAFGFCCYMAFVMILTILLKAFGQLEATISRNMQVMAYLWPRSRPQQCMLILGVCVLNPILEELLFRGILVHQFSLAIESYTLPLILGLVITLGNHAYQGWWSVTTHLPFYLIAVSLLYSPAGLWGAIGFHVAGDLVPFLGLKRSLQRYREIHRRPNVPAKQTVQY